MRHLRVDTTLGEKQFVYVISKLCMFHTDNVGRLYMPTDY